MIRLLGRRRGAQAKRSSVALSQTFAVRKPMPALLFIPTISFKPVENFRDEARALLAKGEANKLIKLCRTESAPRVSFETAERGAAVVALQEQHRPPGAPEALRARLVAVHLRRQAPSHRSRHQPKWCLENRSAPAFRGRQRPDVPRGGAEGAFRNSSRSARVRGGFLSSWRSSKRRGSDARSRFRYGAVAGARIAAKPHHSPTDRSRFTIFFLYLLSIPQAAKPAFQSKTQLKPTELSL